MALWTAPLMDSWTDSWMATAMTSLTVTAKATANATVNASWTAPWSAKVTVERCHCFRAFGKKSDFLPSPKNESSHSSETVISTSLT
jgi:hypothetical protein